MAAFLIADLDRRLRYLIWVWVKNNDLVLIMSVTALLLIRNCSVFKNQALTLLNSRTIKYQRVFFTFMQISCRIILENHLCRNMNQSLNERIKYETKYCDNGSYSCPGSLKIKSAEKLFQIFISRNLNPQSLFRRQQFCSTQRASVSFVKIL